MSEPRIKTLQDLHQYLFLAMQLEHATIPPYLLALYTIHPGTNPDATQVIRVVVVEEMLHLTLAANIMNAVGGDPDLTAQGFVPLYPAYLPDGEDDFLVDLQPFSQEAIETFLKIERPGAAPSEDMRLVRRTDRAIAPRASALAVVPQNTRDRSGGDAGLHFFSIGEFYEEIRRGLKHLHDEMGDGLFPADRRSRQATSEYYYSGGGALIPVVDFDSAVAAIDLIIEQGEGMEAKIFGDQGELAHVYRFEQLKLGKYYMPGDEKHNPSGPELNVDWDAVYPIKKNARLSDYQSSPELHAAAAAFNRSYADFLAFLTRAYNGEPHLLLEAVPKMFVLRNAILQIIHNPIPGVEGVNAAPTFEIAPGPLEMTT